MRVEPLYAAVPLAAIERECPKVLDAGCTACSLCARRKNMVTGEGDPGGLLVVGEAPGRTEDATGRPFSGDSGAYLRKQLALHWKGPIAYDNAVRCFPPSGEPAPDQVAACRPYLSQTVAECSPKIVVALGGVAGQALLGRAIAPFSVRRGYGWLRLGTPSPIPVFLAIHPTAALRNRFVRQWFEDDLSWMLGDPSLIVPPLNQSIKIVESVEDARASASYFSRAEAHFDEDGDEVVYRPWFTYDVETIGRPFDRDFAIISVALCSAGSDEAVVWGKAALADPDVLRPLLLLLSDASVPKVAQNGKYDALAVRAAHGVVVRGTHGDTLLWRKMIDAEADGHLEVMANLVGHGGHKDEAEAYCAKAKDEVFERLRREKAHQGFFPSFGVTGLHANMTDVIEGMARRGIDPESWLLGLLPDDMLYRYNARDALVTARLGEKFEREMQDSHRWLWGSIMCGASEAIEQVEAWGISLDVDAVVNYRRYVQSHLDEANARVKAEAGADFNAQSPPQVAALLYDKLGLTPTAFTDSGKPSTDEDALEGLLDRHPIVADILAVREGVKRLGYADGWIGAVRDDGRIHTSLRLDGARSGRLSSANPNLQNVETPDPDEPGSEMARNCFVAAPGWRLLELDYSQIELRVAAMMSGDKLMKQIFVNGEDYHLRTAQLVSEIVWGVAPDKVTPGMRKAAKITNFRTLFGGGDRSNAKAIKCSIADAEKLREAIFGKFRRLAAWIKECLAESRRTGTTSTWWNGRAAHVRPLWRIADHDDKARSKAEHGAWNTRIQGTAAHFCLASLVECVRWILDDLPPARLALTVHDSLLFEVREDAVPEVAWQAKRIMESWPSDGMPIVADVKIGTRWGSMEKYEVH